MNMGFDIRDPDLRKLVETTDKVTPEMFAKLVLIVDNSINVMKRNQFNDQANNTAIALKRVADLEKTVTAWRLEMNNEREVRAQSELDRAEREVQSAKKRLGLTTDARLEVQKIFEESLKAEVGEVLEDETAKKRLARAKWLSETWSAAGRAVVIAIAVPIALGVLGATILFLAKVFHIIP